MVQARTRRQRLFERDIERESSAFGDGPSVLEQLREEERVRERNLALRRAAEAVDGGPNDIAKIDALVSGSPLAAPELARGRSEGERKPIAKSVASTLPMGIETYDSFNRERELAERNAPIRQALLSIGTDPDDPDFLGGDATPRTGGGTIQPAQEATPSRRVPLTDLPEWVQRGLVAQGVEIPGVAPARTPAQEAADRANLGTVNPGPGGFDSPPMRTRQEIIDDEARTEILGNPNPVPGGFDSPVMRTREEVERSDPLVPERLIEIFKSPNLIFTREQLDFINGFSSETVARAQFIAIAGSSGKQGEADALRNGGRLPVGDDGLGISDIPGAGRALDFGEAIVRGAVAAQPLDDVVRTSVGVLKELAAGDFRGAADEVAVGALEAVRDANPILPVTDRIFRANRERPESALEASTESLLDFLEDTQRPGGGLVNALSPEGSNESIVTDLPDTFRRLREGITTPRDTSGRNVVGFRDLPDENVLGPFSLRDFGGLGAELLLDPTNLLPGGLVDDGVHHGVGKIDDLGRGLGRAFRRTDDAVPSRIVTDLGDPELRAVMELMARGESVGAAQQFAFRQRVSHGVPIDGSYFNTGTTRAALLGEGSSSETAEAIAQRWGRTLTELWQRDPERFLENPRSFEKVNDVVRRWIEAGQRRLNDLAVASDGSSFNAEEAFERLSRIPPTADAAQFEREAIRVIRESLGTPSVPAGFLDFAELAARDAQRRTLEKQILDAIAGLAANDFAVSVLSDLIEKGGIEAAGAILIGLGDGRLLAGSSEQRSSGPAAEPRPTPTPSPEDR